MGSRGVRFARVVALRSTLLCAGAGGWMSVACAADLSDADRAAAALFSELDPVPHLSVEVSESDLQRLGSSTSVRDGGNRPEVPCTVHEGTNIYRQVSLHLKGARGSFRPVEAKPALTLQFNESIKAQRFRGLEKMSLNNSVQDPSYLCEYIGRRMFAQAGLPVPRAAHATVTLNGRSTGLYVLLEGWNKQFLRRHFADASGNFYEPAYHSDLPGPFEVKSGDSPEDHRAVEALAAAINLPMEQRWSALERTLALDGFVTGMALEILLLHWDGYGGNQNNYRLFHDRVSNRVVFFPHGMDQLFALRRSRRDAQLAPPMRGRVAGAIFETSEGLARYYDRIGWLLTNVYQVARVSAEVRRAASRLRPALAEDSVELDRFNDQVERLLEQIESRHADASRQLAVVNTPIHFDGTRPALLRDWQLWRSDAFGGFRQRMGMGQRGYLRINAGGGPSAWRTTVLLEPGRYRFEGQAYQSPDSSSAGSERCTLRSSVSRRTQTSNVEGGLRLVHEFTLTERRHVELRCESDVVTGWVEFDPGSLRLSRLP